MKQFRRWLIFAVVFCCLVLSDKAYSAVKNVIFCIGDGMGLAHVSLARMQSKGLDGKLYIEQMPVTGIMRTHAADALVTDSAASGTAMATGLKTNNGVIALSPDGERYVTILEAAKKEKGMATGLIATSSITHATPASFAAHVKSRSNQTKIAEDLLANKVNVLLGGGRGFFLPKSAKKSKRDDSRDLIGEAKIAGYSYVQTAEELKLAQGPYILGLFQIEAMTTSAPEPSLAELTRKAIEVLNKNDKGFFLMVEGSQIDWASHANDANDCLKQILDFDLAVKVAMDFAAADKQTVVIVTADHETGGLIISGGDMKGQDLKLKWALKDHSGLPVPVYSFGPGTDIFTGVYDNTELPKKIAKLLGIKDFPKIIK